MSWLVLVIFMSNQTTVVEVSLWLMCVVMVYHVGINQHICQQLTSFVASAAKLSFLLASRDKKTLCWEFNFLVSKPR